MSGTAYFCTAGLGGHTRTKVGHDGRHEECEGPTRIRTMTRYGIGQQQTKYQNYRQGGVIERQGALHSAVPLQGIAGRQYTSQGKVLAR